MNEHFNGFGAGVVDEQGGVTAECGDGCHVCFGEFEVENVEVFGHAFGANGLGDDDDAALDEPPEHHLCRGFAVLVANFRQDRIGE